MTTFAEYKAAQETVNTFRQEAIKRVQDYVRSGKSGFGNISVYDFASNDNPENAYGISFSMEIGVNADGNVLVWANPINEEDESLTARVPVEVLEGTLV